MFCLHEPRIVLRLKGREWMRIRLPWKLWRCSCLHVGEWIIGSLHELIFEAFSCSHAVKVQVDWVGRADTCTAVESCGPGSEQRGCGRVARRITVDHTLTDMDVRAVRCRDETLSTWQGVALSTWKGIAAWRGQALLAWYDAAADRRHRDSK